MVGLVPGIIKGTEGFERLGDIKNLNNKEKTEASFSNAKPDYDASTKPKFADLAKLTPL